MGTYQDSDAVASTQHAPTNAKAPEEARLDKERDTALLTPHIILNLFISEPHPFKYGDYECSSFQCTGAWSFEARLNVHMEATRHFRTMPIPELYLRASPSPPSPPCGPVREATSSPKMWERARSFYLIINRHLHSITD